ncbi:MAG: glycosyltransferase family 2 protein, partial [Gemmatimonadaceae bacterium]|nr:glycosyltransferase family 2 protein [Gemmatimonadaceae bacterium]
MLEHLHVYLTNLEWLILAYFGLANAFYGVLLVAASVELRHHLRSIRGESRWRVLGSAAAPRISVLAAAHNEAATIGESLSGLLALYYPNLEIIVVNDGSE